MERRGIDQKTGTVSTAGMQAEPDACSFVNRGKGKMYQTRFTPGRCKIIGKAVSNCFCVFVQNMNTDF